MFIIPVLPIGSMFFHYAAAPHIYFPKHVSSLSYEYYVLQMDWMTWAIDYTKPVKLTVFVFDLTFNYSFDCTSIISNGSLNCKHWLTLTTLIMLASWVTGSRIVHQTNTWLPDWQPKVGLTEDSRNTDFRLRVVCICLIQDNFL